MADDNTEQANSWAMWGAPIVASIVTSLISYLVITIFVLTISYAMNRSIYRSTSLRVLTGVFAGATALLTFWIVLFMPKVHYFGLFPMLDPLAPGSDRRGGILNYFRSSYDPGVGEHRTAVEALVRASLGWRREMREDVEHWVNTSGAIAVNYPVTMPVRPGMRGLVNEERNREAREIGALAGDIWKDRFRGIGGVVAVAAPAAAPGAADAPVDL